MSTRLVSDDAAAKAARERFGDALTQLMTERKSLGLGHIKLSNEGLAAKLGNTTTTISNYRNGNSIPEEPTFEQLVTILFPVEKLQDQSNLQSYEQSFRALWNEAREFSRRGKPGYSRATREKLLFRVPSALTHFVDRASELARLHAFFNSKPAKPWLAIIGVPGSGKSSLASHYARSETNPFEAIWWCNAETRDTLLGGLEELGYKLGVERPGGMRTDTYARFALEAVTHHPWCLVYDNAGAATALEDLLPADATSLIVTTRATGWASYASSLDLDCFKSGESEQLLRSQIEGSSLQGAADLAKTLGHLPLAVAHAGAACAQLKISCADYAKQLRQYLDATAAGVRPSGPTGDAHPVQTVGATMRLAIAALPDDATRALLLFLSFCAPEPIPFYLIDDACGELDGLTADLRLLSLTAFSLASIQTLPDGSRAVLVHRLVQEIGRMIAEDSNWTLSLVDTVLVCLRRYFPIEQFELPLVSNRCSQLIPHVMARWQSLIVSTNSIEVWVALMTAVGRYLRSHGNFDMAAIITRNTADFAEHELAKGNTFRLQALADLAQVHEDEGNREEAKQILREIIPLLSDIWGTNNPSIAYLLIRLATLEQSDASYPEALTAGETALRMLETHDGADPVTIAYCLANIGHSYFWTFRHDQSKAYLTRALASARKLGDAAIRAETLALDGLAALELLWGEPDEGLRLSHEAVARSKAVDRGSEVCHFLDNLASNLFKVGRYLDAQRYYEEALEAAEARGSFDQQAKANDALQGFFRATGDQYSYARIFTTVVEREEQRLGTTPTVLWHRNELVKLLLSIDDLNDAHHHCQMVLDASLSVDLDQAIAQAIHDAARECIKALNALGRQEEALGLAEKLASLPLNIVA